MLKYMSLCDLTFEHFHCNRHDRVGFGEAVRCSLHHLSKRSGSQRLACQTKEEETERQTGSSGYWLCPFPPLPRPPPTNWPVATIPGTTTALASGQRAGTRTRRILFEEVCQKQHPQCVVCVCVCLQ